MSKSTKKWLIAAAVLTVMGVMLWIGGANAMGFHFAGLSTRKFQTNTYELDGDFHSIAIDVETAEVRLLPSEDGRCRVECLEEERFTHTAGIHDGVLTVGTVDSRKWYDYIGISLQTPSVTVYLPKDAYIALSVTTQTGNIQVPDRYRFETVRITGTTANITCEAAVSERVELQTTTGKITLGGLDTQTVMLRATTGRIELRDVTCQQLTAQNSTGLICLKHVIAKESMRLANSTGGVRFDGCDGARITVETSTGSVKGTLLSEKIYMTDTATGRISVPKTASGGICAITTGTGNIEISQTGTQE